MNGLWRLALHGTQPLVTSPPTDLPPFRQFDLVARRQIPVRRPLLIRSLSARQIAAGRFLGCLSPDSYVRLRASGASPCPIWRNESLLGFRRLLVMSLLLATVLLPILERSATQHVYVVFCAVEYMRFPSILPLKA